MFSNAVVSSGYHRSHRMNTNCLSTAEREFHLVVLCLTDAFGESLVFLSFFLCLLSYACVFVCIYIFICIYVFIYIYTHMYIHSCPSLAFIKY